MFFSALDEFNDGGTQSYKGLLLSVQRRASRTMSLTGNYTSSYCTSDYADTNGFGPSAGTSYLDPNNPETWNPRGSLPLQPCNPSAPQSNLIWWDVFPIPSGYAPTTDGAGNNPLLNSNGKAVQVPGYFKMRSRFVDYAGFYVLHCHILAHEDRGMMTIVEVAPVRTPYSHH